MKKWFYLVLIGFLLFTGACESNTEQASQDPDPENVAENPAPDEEENKGKNDEVPKREVRIGIAGSEEDFTFEWFENQWLSMWYDPALQTEEETNQVSFTDEDQGVSFTVKSLDEPIDVEEEIKPQMLEDGYDFHNEFSLDYREGKGYIFHSYDFYVENRHAVDIYVLDEEGQTLLVECHIPDKLEEKYVPRFEYMLESLQLSGTL